MGLLGAVVVLQIFGSRPAALLDQSFPTAGAAKCAASARLSYRLHSAAAGDDRPKQRPN